MNRSRVLFISPNPADAGYLSRMLSPLSLKLEHADTVEQARAILPEEAYRVILTEAKLPDGNWLDVLALAQQLAPATEVIVTDPLADARIWSEVLNRGGYDMLVQPFEEPEVQRILSHACARTHQTALHTAL